MILSATRRLALLGHVNDATTAFANLLKELVAANFVAGLLADDPRRLLRLLRQKLLARCIRPEQGLDAREQNGVVAARALQIALAFLRGRQVKRVLENLFFAI